ncbi:MAG: type VI secretion system lipoprotein TssJ [Campylobacter sp.]|nr:type VI secretion system lipoprotein TssJ [Campylobacter sp.]
MKKILFFSIFMLFFTACSSINVFVKNNPSSNLNNRGDDVPITIVLFELDDTKRFMEASDLDLLQKPEQVLSRDLIDFVKLQVEPSTQKSILEIKDERVKYVGILVVYADQKDGRKTKEVKKISDLNYSGLLFNITSQNISAIEVRIAN